MAVSANHNDGKRDGKLFVNEGDSFPIIGSLYHDLYTPTTIKFNESNKNESFMNAET